MIETRCLYKSQDIVKTEESGSQTEVIGEVAKVVIRARIESKEIGAQT